MKYLYLLRHAETKVSSIYSDLERPLTSRGEEQCKKIAEYLNQEEDLPLYFCVSPALRTLETVNNINGKLNSKAEVVCHDFLYLAKADSIYDFIVNLSNDYNKVVIVGHNPSISELSFILSSHINGVSEAFFTPGKMIKYELQIKSWRDLKQHQGKILWKISY
jgi:phosphohistidine phosphatase